MEVTPIGKVCRRSDAESVPKISPAGATLVEVRRIRGARLWVTGLDALDGSPVLDIKAARKTEGRKVPGDRGQADLPGREPRSAR